MTLSSKLKNKTIFAACAIVMTMLLIQTAGSETHLLMPLTVRAGTRSGWRIKAMARIGRDMDELMASNTSVR